MGRTKAKAKERADGSKRAAPRVAHFGGVISTNKDLATKKFLLRKWGNEETLSGAQRAALGRIKGTFGSLKQLKQEIQTSKVKFQKVVHSDLPVSRDNKEMGSTKSKVVALSGVNKNKCKTTDDFLSRSLDDLSAHSFQRKKKKKNQQKTSFGVKNRKHVRQQPPNFKKKVGKEAQFRAAKTKMKKEKKKVAAHDHQSSLAQKLSRSLDDV